MGGGGARQCYPQLLALLALLGGTRGATVRLTVGNTSVSATHASATPEPPKAELALFALHSHCSLPSLSPLSSFPSPVAFSLFPSLPSSSTPSVAAATMSPPPPPPSPFALLVPRGGCSFDAKMALAIAAGASVLLVADQLLYAPGPNISGAVGSGSMLLTDPCAVDCSLGAVLLDSAELSRKVVLGGMGEQCALVCGGRACGFADPPPNATAHAGEASDESVAAGAGGAVWPIQRACCAVDEDVDMQISPVVKLPGEAGRSSPALPALFLSVTDSTRLLAAAGPSALEGPGLPRLLIDAEGGTGGGGGSGVPQLDPSALYILVMGTAIAALTSAAGARAQHAQAMAAASGATATGADDAEPLQMSAPMALAFLGMASTLLLVLYMLLQAGYHVILLLLVVLFATAAVHSLLVLGAPLAAAVLTPRLRSTSLRLGALATLDVPTLAAMPLAIGVGVAWLAYRHAQWAWALQDLMGAAVCASFLRTVQLPSLEARSTRQPAPPPLQQ